MKKFLRFRCALVVVALTAPQASTFAHFKRLKTPMAPWETDIKLPNINCPKCTLQVIQFMADHGYNQPGGYAYHHGADLQITEDPSKPISKGWPVPNK